MTATKIGRGFHRLALLLAALPLLIGGSLSVYIAFDLANRLWEQHQTLVCAHQHIAAQKPGENVFDQFNTVKLKQIGCSNSDDWLRVAPKPSTPDAHRDAGRLCGGARDRLGHWPAPLTNVCFGGKNGHGAGLSLCPLMTHSGLCAVLSRQSRAWLP